MGVAPILGKKRMKKMEDSPIIVVEGRLKETIGQTIERDSEVTGL